MKVVALLAVCLAVVVALEEAEYRNSFRSFMQTYGKSYHHEEFRTRYATFKANLDFINAHNSQPSSFTVAMNKFGDLTNAEFNRLFKGLKMPTNLKYPTVVRSRANSDLPTEFDWRNNSFPVVTKVKNQEQCGSCWAFSTTGSTEGCHALTTQKLVSLSEQNLVDCSGNEGNDGCDGGLMTQAMQYIIDNKGIDTEASYPYTAEDGDCQFSSSNVGATLTGYTNVNTGDESDLQQKVSRGPTSVAIDAGESSFQFYSNGVYYEPDCSSTELDHGVLAVGWGVLDSQDYWIVKNSWGSDWGMEGYILMSRNRNNNCGIATMATLPQC